MILRPNWTRITMEHIGVSGTAPVIVCRQSASAAELTVLITFPSFLRRDGRPPHRPVVVVLLIFTRRAGRGLGRRIG